MASIHICTDRIYTPYCHARCPIIGFPLLTFHVGPLAFKLAASIVFPLAVSETLPIFDKTKLLVIVTLKKSIAQSPTLAPESL